jgi:hypothetical protein
MFAEPFEAFTFAPVGAVVYQLGTFGTARKELQTFPLITVCAPELLLLEMDHRIKNLFALAISVLSLSGRSAGSVPELQVRALLSSPVPIWVPTDSLRLRSGREIQCRKTLKND